MGKQTDFAFFAPLRFKKPYVAQLSKISPSQFQIISFWRPEAVPAANPVFIPILSAVVTYGILRPSSYMSSNLNSWKKMDYRYSGETRRTAGQ